MALKAHFQLDWLGIGTIKHTCITAITNLIYQ